MDGSGEGLILTNPEGIEFTYTLRFQFVASNNEAEYEALIVGLRIAAQMGVKNVHVSVDSKLVANQVLGTYVAKEENMVKYLDKVKILAVIHYAVVKMCWTAPGGWGIDIDGHFPEGPGKVKFLIVAMDYFTKWIEAKAVATITGGQVKKFVWDNIVCRFGLPGKKVSNNDNQFSDNPFKDWCGKLNITQRFASVKHSQSNGLVERANQSLGEGIKARLGERNKNWVEELPYVLWAHCTMIKSSHCDTPFSLTYGTEAVIPTEIGMPTYRTTAVDVVSNDEELRLNLDLLEERRERAAICEAKTKLKITKYYNAQVRGVTFRPGDFVYRSNDANHAVAGGKLGPKWEEPYEAEYVIREIHEGSCSMHAGPRSVVAKAIWLGYYWPTMHRDARDMIQKCNDCQIHRPITRSPQQPLIPITAPWPFYQWGIDIDGPFPEGPGKVKFLIVVMDYFTKWIEAKAVATITGGQARLGERNKNWVEELPYVLWAHRTMIKSSHCDTPFSLTYGTKAVIPTEIGMPTYRTTAVDVVSNDEELLLNLDLLEERRECAAICEAKTKLKITKYYNARVRGVTFRPGDFVYRSNDASHAVAGGKLGPKWEEPYEVTEALRDGAYKLRSMDETILPRT
nr:reverse transcriptase domain-containing protein [Tanacetum cinerariifolium]